MYYIISLKHTLREENFVTLWRPDNAGYCYQKESAGVYEAPVPGYHDDEGNIPILITEAEKLFVTPETGPPGLTIPNNRKTWAALGVKMGRRSLTKIKK